MKKLLFATCMMLGFAGITLAQPPVKSKTATKTTKATKVAVTPVKSATTTTVATSKTTTTTPVRKDGKPDMRFKVNKETAKPKGPLKADGTPDKRFKANKKS